MGGSGRWLKSLIGLKKPQLTAQEKKDRKWKLWKSGSGGRGGHVAALSEASESSFGVADGAFATAMAAVVRAPTRDFMIVRQEWAAIRIQTIFRAFLARRALRALRAVVRIQAIFRGRQVRKQAAITLRCMQALVRVQTRVRASSIQTSTHGQGLHDHHNQADPIKQAEQGWCDSPGTVEEVRTKLQLKQKGAIKRERAISYSQSQQQLRTPPSPNSRISKPMPSQKRDQKNSGWNWIDSWIPAKPWESKFLEEINSNLSEGTPISIKHGDKIIGSRSSFSECESVKVRWNNVSTRISANPPMSGPIMRSSSGPCSEPFYDESTTSSSSISNSETQISKPSYMSLTESIKAKQRGSSPSHHMQKQLAENLQFHKKTMPLSSLDTVALCKDLYPPMHLDRYGWVKSCRTKHGKLL
ncbi:hypothetical protein NMG60_11002429 [Bertholletia excelsa]